MIEGQPAPEERVGGSIDQGGFVDGIPTPPIVQPRELIPQLSPRRNRWRVYAKRAVVYLGRNRVLPRRVITFLINRLGLKHV